MTNNYIKSLYISSVEPHSGSLVACIGVMEMLKGTYEKVAFFKPIISDEEKTDDDITFMIEHFKLDIDYNDCVGFKVSDYVDAYSEDKEDKLHEAIISKIEKLYTKYDFVLISGYARSIFESLFDFDINLQIAKNLDTAYVPIINGNNKSKSKLLNETQIISETLKHEELMPLAIIINRCNPDIIPSIKSDISLKFPDEQIYLLPEIKELNMPTLEQVSLELNAKHILVQEDHLQHLVYGNKIAAMGVENYLSRINNGDIVIVPGDRVDIILATLLSFYAKTHSNITGIILSGGMSLSDPILNLLKDFSNIAIPVFSVQYDSYGTAIALNNIAADIRPQNIKKITLAKGIFENAIDKEKIINKFQQNTIHTLTPVMFEYKLFEKAKKERKTIVLPESSDVRILKATEILLQRDIVDIILLGNSDALLAKCEKLHIDISKAKIVDPTDDILREEFSQVFYEMRKEKGLTLKVARDAMTHVSYFATMMVYEGIADGMVSGATHTTADTIRPALQIIKTKPDTSVVSSIFFMCLDTKVLVYGDCAVNMDPTAEQLAQIAVSSADSAKMFGIEPKVALLSYSTGSSGSGPDVEKVRRATELAKELRPEYLIEGPIQYDAAIDKRVAQSKLPDSKVAGAATVFIFPDLNTGNNTYKAVQRSTDALAIGPILQGLRLPINDLSRGCLIEDIVNTVAITAIQAQSKEEK
ncbi:Phosphate acetyltransferase [hydrothermal vent metagenome]|uniref:Phosphate acetyltransferase n=1 Tax=hydrothermal vent metagenome TaxID=652676 RepID=A0A1W1EDU7_9ZZZZ